MTEKRFIMNNGELFDTVTNETFKCLEDVVETLNYYEETCLKYEKTIRDLKDGAYKEPLPITQRK